MWQAQEKRKERGARRKIIEPASILLGHEVKNFMTVILLDGALSILHNCMGFHARIEHRTGSLEPVFFDS